MGRRLHGVHRGRRLGQSETSSPGRGAVLVWVTRYHQWILFSTPTDMQAATIVTLHRARFSMEFPFRDAKQCAGLSECQSRQIERLHFHWNVALLAVSTTRLARLSDQRSSPLVFSMDGEKCRAYKEFFAQNILGILAIDPTDPKLPDLLADLPSLGVKDA